MRRTLPRFFLSRLVLFAGLAAFCLHEPVSRAAADDLSGFSVMLQLGDSEVPQAIEIAPNHRWFLAASQGAIYLSDLESGAVLRSFAAPGSLRRVAISKDGSAVFAASSLDDGSEKLLGWNAETGRPIANAASEAPASDDPGWSLIRSGYIAAGDTTAVRKYLLDQKIDQLVDVSRVERIESTNHQNIVQVTVSGEKFDGDEAFAAYRYYFIDIIQKRIAVEVAGKSLNTSCGQPHGAFAFDGRYLIVAPTELDASSFFINSVVVDTKANPPVVKWSRPCQDFQVAGLSMKNGLIVVSPSPDKVTIRDPATARALAVFDDIHGSDVLAWSRDLTTFATGFHETSGNNQGEKFGISILRFGRKLFIPTDQDVQEIRFSPDGSAVFALMQTGWAAWDTSSGANLPSASLPLSDTDPEVWRAREIVSPDGKLKIIDQRQLIDAATGRVLVARHNLSLSQGWKHVWAHLNLRSFAVWDPASGQQLWTATAGDMNSEDFLVLEFPDGRVRLSDGAEWLVKLVRGFEVRPFDAAARRAFFHP